MESATRTRPWCELGQADRPPDVWELHAWAAEAANAAYRDGPCLIVWDFQLDQAGSTTEPAS